MKRNVSFKKGAPKIEEIDHVHFFHTVNAQLVPQKYTSTIGGHFHEITWGVAEDGVTPVVKSVGPPMTYRYVKKPSGQKKMLSRVSWKDLDSDSPDAAMSDNHTHVFTYIHSEEIHEKTIRSVTAAPLETRMADAGIVET